jgi:hypothetical protein
MAVQGPSRAGRPCRQSRTISQTRPPTSNRRLNVGECFCIREILFRTQCRAGSTLSLSVPPSLLNALALRRSDRSYQFHPPRHEYGLVPPAYGGTGRQTRGAGTACARKVGTSAHEEARWRTVRREQEFKHCTTICVYRAMRRSRPAAPRMVPRLQQEELSHPACRCRATGHMRRRGLGKRRVRESEKSKSE